MIKSLRYLISVSIGHPPCGQPVLGVLLLILALLVGSEGNPVIAEGETDSSLVGRLLIARESLNDPNFAQTVVYMIVHDTRGAMGLVINRRLGDASATKLLEEMGVEAGDLDATISIFSGGPVERERGFLLHSDDAMLDNSQSLPDGFALSSVPEMIRRIAEGQGPKGFRFVLGYAGWGPGQLEAEIARGSWWDIEADPALVFERDESSIWRRAVDAHGIEL